MKIRALLNRLREKRESGQGENIYSHYERFFNLSMDLMAVASVRDGRWVQVNPALCQTLGWSEAELLDTPFMEMVHPEDRTRSEQAMTDLAAGKPLVQCEVRIRCKDGRYKWIAWNTAPYSQEDLCYCVGQDVTERRNTEEQIRTTLESIGDGFLALDKDWRFIYINDQAQRLLGMNLDDLLDRNFWDVFAPALGTLAETEYRKAATGESRDFDYFYEPWGRWFHIRAFPRDGGGISIYFQDITDRKQAEEQIRDLARFPEENPFPVLRLSQDGIVLYTNKPGEALLAQWNSQIGQPVPEEWRELITRVLRSDQYATREVSRGEQVFSVIMAPIQEGRYVNLYGREITKEKQVEEALRQSEARLRATLRSTADEIWMVDTQGRIVSLSNSVMENLGVRSNQWADVEAALDQLEVFHPDGTPRPRQDNILPRALRGEVIRNEREMIRNLATGQLRWREVSGAPIRDAEGRLIGGVAVARDITARKRAEDALKELTETLEQRVSERTEQLRALALQLSQAEQQERKRLAKILHDHLQQLIVAARMQIGWVEVGDDLKGMQETAREVGHILQEAVDASRNLAVDLSPPVLHEAGLIGGLNWLVLDMEKKHQFHVDLQAEKEAEPAFEEMRIMLFESVRELLLNAVKHAGVKQAQVSLIRMEIDQIKLIVSDEGKGFDPARLKMRSPDEVSFGLFSLQERLAHIGGQVLIESAPGKGTRVTLTIPNGGVVKAAEKIAEAAQDHKETVSLRHKSGLCSVLIVDDHRIMRQGLVRMFRSEPDIEVIGEAADGPEAIAKADQLLPDIIIMDVNLGAMSGVEATRRILQRHPEIRVVGLSMHADKDVADAMLAAGACAYRTKSGPSEELVEAVKECWHS